MVVTSDMSMINIEDQEKDPWESHWCNILATNYDWETQYWNELACEYFSLIKCDLFWKYGSTIAPIDGCSCISDQLAGRATTLNGSPRKTLNELKKKTYNNVQVLRCCTSTFAVKLAEEMEPTNEEVNAYNAFIDSFVDEADMDFDGMIDRDEAIDAAVKLERPSPPKWDLQQAARRGSRISRARERVETVKEKLINSITSPFQQNGGATFTLLTASCLLGHYCKPYGLNRGLIHTFSDIHTLVNLCCFLTYPFRSLTKEFTIISFTTFN